MIPFTRMIRYGNVIPEYGTMIGYEFGAGTIGTSTGAYPVHPRTPTELIAVPGSTGFMQRLTNITYWMDPTNNFSIGTKDFEMTFTFYLYAGTSYDVLLSHVSDAVQAFPVGGIRLQIGDAGYGNRLQLYAGNIASATMWSLGVTRTEMTNRVNKLVVKRVNGIMSCTMNDDVLLIGVGTGASNQSTVVNTQSVNTKFLYFGETPPGTTQWAVDMGLINYSVQIIKGGST